MKYSALLFSGVLLVTLPSVVLAQSTVTSNTHAATAATPNTATTVVAPPRAPIVSSNSGTFKQTMQTDRQALQSQIQAARQAFRQKLQLIKDTKKQQIVSDINDKILQINTTQTNRMASVAAQLSTTLMRISSQAAQIKSSGKNTATVDSAILAAQTAITGAQTAISTQAAKQYTLTFTSDATLRQTIQPTVLQFRQDLINTQATLKTARLTVVRAYQALLAVQTGGTNPAPIGSSSAKPVQ